MATSVPPAALASRGENEFNTCPAHADQSSTACPFQAFCRFWSATRRQTCSWTTEQKKNFEEKCRRTGTPRRP
eukprot:3798850-Rhodomonas_salina.1